MKDIVKESMTKEEYQKVARQLVLYGIIASVMIYAGFTSAVVVSKMDKFWVDIQLPSAFTTSSILIALSSLTLVAALFFAKKEKKTLVVSFISLTLLLCVAFSVFQFKGWSTLVDNGNYIGDKIFFDYGAYGDQYIIEKNGEEIYHDGQNYSVNKVELSASEVEDLKGFVYQICGDALRLNEAPYAIKKYSNPFVIKNVASSKVLEFKDGVAYLEGIALTVSQRNELFKFAFGVYNDMPYFMLKGKYGEDFTINLNGEKLEFENRKLFFPARMLSQEEIVGIKKNVFQGGKEYSIKKGKVFLDGNEIDIQHFETYFDLNHGIQIHLKNGEWKQVRQELNTVQYGEFYQTGNVASSYIWILTIIHFIHLIVGFILLVVLLIRSIQGHYNAQNQMGLRVGGIFWHFLGALWIYLFVFLQIID